MMKFDYLRGVSLHPIEKIKLALFVLFLIYIVASLAYISLHIVDLLWTLSNPLVKLMKGSS